MYAVQGMREWVPRWRSNGYRTAQKKAVANADLFQILDCEVTALGSADIPVILHYVPREKNNVADGLAKAGARRGSGGLGGGVSDILSGLFLGRPMFDQIKPLVQYTPDGRYWAQVSRCDAVIEAVVVDKEAMKGGS